MKRAQVWQLDFLFAIVIGTLTLILFVNFALDQTSSSDLADLALIATATSEEIMTQGLPINWTPDTIRSIGILDENGRVNETKLTWLYNFTQNENRLLYTQRHFYTIRLFINNTEQIIANKEFIGFNNSNASSAITISRFVLYNGSIAELEVSVWN